MLGPIGTERLTSLFDGIEGLGKSSHLTAQEYPRAVDTFVELVEAGETPDPDDVREFADDHGGSTQHARDLGKLADTVNDTMKRLSRA